MAKLEQKFIAEGFRENGEVIDQEKFENAVSARGIGAGVQEDREG